MPSAKTLAVDALVDEDYERALELFDQVPNHDNFIKHLIRMYRLPISAGD